MISDQIGKSKKRAGNAKPASTFSAGAHWPLSRLTESHVSGLPAARAHVESLLQAVLAWHTRIAAGQSKAQR